LPKGMLFFWCKLTIAHIQIIAGQQF